MIDFNFYQTGYMGSAIPEKCFSGMAARAVAALENIRRRYRVVPTDAVSEKMALCAMAETLYSDDCRGAGLSSATVGGVSVRYESAGKRSLQCQLLERARIYLDIYRGSAPC